MNLMSWICKSIGIAAVTASSTSTYGEQVVRFVTGSAPGGGVDIVAR